MGDVHQIRRGAQGGNQRRLDASEHFIRITHWIADISLTTRTPTGRLRLVAFVILMLAIVAPMATELAGLRRAIGDPHGTGVTIRVIGVGKRRAEAGIAEVAAELPDAIMAVGFCGGADPTLRTGDLHVADVFHSVDRSEPIAADPGLICRAKAWTDRNNHRLVCGPSVTVDAVAGAQAKRALHAETGAASVNMEDYWAARTAADHEIPFGSVRAVLDTADDELPDYLGDVGDGIFDALRGLATHPGSIFSLIRLSRKSTVARDRLADCVSGLLVRASVPSPSIDP